MTEDKSVWRLTPYPTARRKHSQKNDRWWRTHVDILPSHDVVWRTTRERTLNAKQQSADWGTAAAPRTSCGARAAGDGNIVWGTAGSLSPVWNLAPDGNADPLSRRSDL